MVVRAPGEIDDHDDFTLNEMRGSGKAASSSSLEKTAGGFRIEIAESRAFIGCQRSVN